MSFREKSAWISLVTTLGVYAYYFWNLLGTQDMHDADLFGLFARCVTVLVVMQVVFHILAAIRNPRDANAPQDERERMIALKSVNIAYYILAGGAVLAGGGLVFMGQPVAMANLLLLALVLAEAVNYASQIVFFRRGV